MPPPRPLEEVGDPVSLGADGGEGEEEPGEIEEHERQDDEAEVGPAQLVEDVDQPIAEVLRLARLARLFLAAARARVFFRLGFLDQVDRVVDGRARRRGKPASELLEQEVDIDVALLGAVPAGAP